MPEAHSVALAARIYGLKPSDLHAPGAVDDLLAFHRAMFGGWRMEADGDGSEGGQEGAEGAPGGAGDAGKGTGPQFPANTAPEDMTATQRAAYYRAETTKWRGRAETNYATLRELGITDKDTAAQVKQKLAEHGELTKSQMSAIEKAAADASEKAKADADALYRPQLVKAELRAKAAAKGVSTETLDGAMQFLDLSKLQKSSGEPDVKQMDLFIEGLTPTKGTTQRQSGPSTFGMGYQRPADAAPGSQGRAMAERRGYVKPAAQ